LILDIWLNIKFYKFLWNRLSLARDFKLPIPVFVNNIVLIKFIIDSWNLISCIWLKFFSIHHFHLTYSVSVINLFQIWNVFGLLIYWCWHWHLWSLSPIHFSCVAYHVRKLVFRGTHVNLISKQMVRLGSTRVFLSLSCFMLRKYWLLYLITDKWRLRWCAHFNRADAFVCYVLFETWLDSHVHSSWRTMNTWTNTTLPL